jgi:hypothetical protein
MVCGMENPSTLRSRGFFSLCGHASQALHEEIVRKRPQASTDSQNGPEHPLPATVQWMSSA